MEINIITTKNLGDDKIEQIRKKLTALSYISESYPAVKVMQRQDASTYPGVYIQKGGQKILDLTPNTKLKSFVFFEKTSYNLNDDNEFNLSLIFWGQLDKINSSKEYDFTDEILNEITNILKLCGAFNIISTFEDVFSRYNLHNSEKQMFMYPHTAFKIDFTIFC
jgi:hypothetical protein